MSKRINSWHDRSEPDAPWYDARALDPRQHAQRDVHLLGTDYETFGRLGLHRGTGKPAWLEWREALGEHVLLAMWRRRAPGEDARGREPIAWRPTNDRWPFALPAPLLGPRVPALPADEPPEPAPLPEIDGWPYPYTVLGERTQPATLDECEARILRAWRKMDSMPTVGIQQQSMASDIPRELYYLMRRQQMAEDIAEQRSRVRGTSKIADTTLRTARIAWVPTRRDNGDWDYALDWLRALTADERRLFEMRGANPPFTWRQISRQTGETHVTARNRYLRALGKCFVYAKKQAKKDLAA